MSESAVKLITINNTQYNIYIYTYITYFNTNDVTIHSDRTIPTQKPYRSTVLLVRIHAESVEFITYRSYNTCIYINTICYDMHDN